jgi:hypothetical protein
MIATVVVTAASCSSPPKQSTPQPAAQSEPAKPPDESRRFPQNGRIETKVVENHLLDRPFMPGGTLAHYKKGKSDYDMFAARLATPTDAALLLLDWKKDMPDATLVASFGGYFGQDAGRPTFVFTKGPWIAGIAGLPLKQADAEARVLAAELE